MAAADAEAAADVEAAVNEPAVCHSKQASTLVLLNVNARALNEDLDGKEMLKRVIADAVNTVLSVGRRRRSLLESSQIIWGMRPAPPLPLVQPADIADLIATSDDQYLTTVDFSVLVEGMSVEEFGGALMDAEKNGVLANGIATEFQESQFKHALLARDETQAGFITTRFYGEESTKSVVGTSDDSDYNILVGACVAFAVIIIVLLVFALIVFRRDDDEGDGGATEVAMSTIPKHHTADLMDGPDTHHEL